MFFIRFGLEIENMMPAGLVLAKPGQNVVVWTKKPHCEKVLIRM